MIFVPEKEKCLLWNDKLDDRIFIIYQYDENLTINFQWYKDNNEKLDPFYLAIEEIKYVNNLSMTVVLPVFKCLEPACQASAQLRYNDIIKKWFVTCPSSMICTKNDDQDELELFKNMKTFNESAGFYDDLVNAILGWNDSIAKDIHNQCKFLKEIYEKH